MRYRIDCHVSVRQIRTSCLSRVAHCQWFCFVLRIDASQCQGGETLQAQSELVRAALDSERDTAHAAVAERSGTTARLADSCSGRQLLDSRSDRV